MKLSDEELEALKSGSLSPTAKIIEYLEEQKKANEKAKWKIFLFSGLSWLGGMLTTLLVQYIIYKLGWS